MFTVQVSLKLLIQLELIEGKPDKIWLIKTESFTKGFVSSGEKRDGIGSSPRYDGRANKQGIFLKVKVCFCIAAILALSFRHQMFIINICQLE